MICKKHGQLEDEEIRSYVRSRRGRMENVKGCKICHRETASSARNANREKANLWNKEHRKKFPEKYKEYEKRHIEKVGIEFVRKREVLRIHGLTIKQHEKMLNEQNNLCAICKENETRKGRSGSIAPLCIDHCHECRKKGKDDVRGLICHSCNIGIGSFKDNVELMKQAIKYLEKHECN